MAAKKKSDESFAFKMKKMRSVNKIELGTLAKATGLSEEYLEKIENGETMPPVSTIIQISNALVVDSGKFLSAENKPSRKLKAQSFKKRSEAYSYKTLTPDAEHRHMKGFQVSIPAESDHEGVDYKHPGEEFVYVLEGSLDIQIGRKKHKLKKGQSIHFDSDRIHKLTNPGKKKTELIVIVYTP
ncbi:MAG TPA: cupin domain-containing protein [bacterium]|nr:cupin domain-containing protein [bacterium]